ncbi:hypothetical protein NDU88_001262 [Pleurodeles waltl]|uniref:Uncharacterized protein n=1 Tax=Pleurodeles waltl TaxID=8319 RepID=A0AAV7UVJ0_PLEWA|nr:hypothetical protein NDU88_001262 [Pleurodeles waltl]
MVPTKPTQLSLQTVVQPGQFSVRDTDQPLLGAGMEGRTAGILEVIGNTKVALKSKIDAVDLDLGLFGWTTEKLMDRVGEAESDVSHLQHTAAEHEKETQYLRQTAVRL